MRLRCNDGKGQEGVAECAHKLSPDEVSPIIQREFASENTPDSLAQKREMRLREARERRLDEAWEDLGHELRRMAEEEPEF